jgi:hypothetical protein
LNGAPWPAVEQEGSLLFETQAEPGSRLLWEILPDDAD